jgi:hypothetical protein
VLQPPGNPEAFEQVPIGPVQRYLQFMCR